MSRATIFYNSRAGFKKFGETVQTMLMVYDDGNITIRCDVGSVCLSHGISSDIVETDFMDDECYAEMRKECRGNTAKFFLDEMRDKFIKSENHKFDKF